MHTNNPVFTLSEEQNIIRETAARYLDQEFPFKLRQEISHTEQGFQNDLWQYFAESGWLGIAIPEKQGGFDGTLIDAALIFQQMGRTLARSPYLDTLSASLAILLAGNEQQKSDHLQAIIEGSGIITCGWYESDNPEDPAQTSLSANGNNWLLNGCKRLVPWGNQSDKIIINAMYEETLCLIIIDRQSPGIRIRPYRMYDGSRAADIEFSDVIIDQNNILGSVNDNTHHIVLKKVIDTQTALTCMEASTIMWAIHNQTLEYMQTREQFGQTLSSMQALQHRIVDVYIQCQLVQSMAEDAIIAATQLLQTEEYNEQCVRRISAAKAFVGETGRQVGKEGIQLHGGIGMTTDIPIGHYLKRLTAIDTQNGNPAWHRKRYYELDIS